MAERILIPSRQLFCHTDPLRNYNTRQLHLSITLWSMPRHSCI